MYFCVYLNLNNLFIRHQLIFCSIFVQCSINIPCKFTCFNPSETFGRVIMANLAYNFHLLLNLKFCDYKLYIQSLA
jgi:hypothetical protein